MNGRRCSSGTGNCELDPDRRSALADVERVCEAYWNAYAQSGEAPDSDLHKAVTKRMNVLRDKAGRDNLLECAVTIDNPPVISQAQLDRQPYLLATHRCGGPAQRRLRPRPPISIPAQSLPDLRPIPARLHGRRQRHGGLPDPPPGLRPAGRKAPGGLGDLLRPPVAQRQGHAENTLKHVLGNRLHVRINVRMLMEQKFARQSAQPEPDLMALRGARLAYASEASQKMSIDQAKIKDMTGGGYITAR
jgi:putative DNA primase/helicase